MATLSLRLKTIATLVPRGARVCDVGTDHAYLPIHLAESGIAKKVIATDLNEKPLENALKNIEKSGVCGVELRLCDGLSKVKDGEADTVITAGMGGEVIVGILSACEWLKNRDVTIILQPTTSAEILRKFLCDNCFEILKEVPVYENQKLYSIMLVKYTGVYIPRPEHYYFIGEIPPTNDGFLYLKKQQNRIAECMKAFENIQSKHQEYLAYKEIDYAINTFLTENKNVT